MADKFYIGLMSGTSLDGVDAVLVDFGLHGMIRCRIHATHFEPMPPHLRARLQSLCTADNDEIERMGILDIELAHLFAEAVLRVMATSDVTANDIVAIGSHGQTIRHRPESGSRFTLQIGDPNLIAEVTGITTVADFRRRDIAAGGQGAPLVPAFHAAMFRSSTESRAVINIGGMANITWLPADIAKPVGGFDTGPGNVLLDAWHQHHRNGVLDAQGQWASSGKVNASLLDRLLSDDFFSQPPPRSTGRERFNLAWLTKQLSTLATGIEAADVQATLAEFTAHSITDALHRWCGKADGIYLCGGGVHNKHLCARIAQLLPATTMLNNTGALGIDPDWVEATAFAWLARERLANRPGNLPEVTGARNAVVLGGVYPGRPGPEDASD